MRAARAGSTGNAAGGVGDVGGEPGALGEIETRGRRLERRLPVLRKFVAPLGRHGTVWRDTHMTARNIAVKRRCAIPTGHGLDQASHRCRDGESGPQASLMAIGLHAVELAGAAPADGPSERRF